MGCFNTTCFLSNSPIMPGNKVKLFVLVSNENSYCSYPEEPKLLNDFDPIIQNKEFNSVFEILTNNPENNKQYRNFSIIQLLSEVGDEVVELFREVAKNYG